MEGQYQYVGLDVHKKSCTAVRMTSDGRIVERVQIKTEAGSLQGYFGERPAAKVVMEACYNWQYVWDALEGVEEVAEKKLAHPLEVKAIANARVRTDTIDGRVLADLYRADLIPEAYAPSWEARDKKNLLRHRATLVRWQTMIKNRIHPILDRQGITDPVLAGLSDKFGKVGMQRLKETKLKGYDDQILRESLEILESLRKRIRQLEKQIVGLVENDQIAMLIKTIPGIGYQLALLIRSEIDEIERFLTAPKLSAYCGLVPSTYQSGDRLYHGRITKLGNRYLRWAFCEAAQKVHISSPRLGRLYRRIKERKGSNTAKVAVARKLAEITWGVWTTKTPYREINILSGHPSLLTKGN
jgi:transposase